MSKEVATIDEIKKFCNVAREAGGAKQIADLIPSLPSDGEACLIARNLNFECDVFSYDGKQFEKGEEIWAMKVDDRSLAQKIAKALKLKVDLKEGPYGYGKAEIILPKKITRVAKRFDLVEDIFGDEDLTEPVVINNKGRMFEKTKLLEDKLTATQKLVIKTYWKYVHRDYRKDWVKPSFV